MAQKSPDFATPVRRVLIAVTVLALMALFLFWRIDSPRAEMMRTAMIDRIVPRFEWALLPVTKVTEMVAGFQSYARIYEQNQELRRELQRMSAWREAAVQLEQENSKLMAQNNVRIDPALTSVTGVVLVDSGSAFRQSVLLNVGAQDGIVEGWATMDGLGLVGRIAGVGKRTSRVVLLTDPSSRLPVTVQPTGERALLTGDNTPLPLLEFVEQADNIRPGDRVVTSGDGGVFPPGLLVGQVAQGSDGRLRLRMAADYERLEFLRVLRSHPAEAVVDSGAVVRSQDRGLIGPQLPVSPVEAASATDPLDPGTTP